MNNIIQGDCLEVLKTYPDNHFTSVITDPPYGLSFMGKKWDYDVPSIEIWKEVLRVLKPGGTMLCFAGSRTQHRMAVNIEDAGFLIKDCLMFLYGSGFPKSTNISKQIEKVDFYRSKEWEGYGTALKPAYEPIIMCMKPNDGTYANNALKWGVSGINIDKSRIEGESWGSRPAIKLTSKGYKGGAFGQAKWEKKEGVNIDKGLGRFPANIILDEESATMLDDQSGVLSKGHAPKLSKSNPFGGNNNLPHEEIYFESGGASRFFKCFSIENECDLCYNTLHKVSKEELCKNIYVNGVEKNSKIIQEITENIALLSVEGLRGEQLVHLVKSVGNLCDLCAINIVQSLVVILESQKDAQNLAESPAIQDFITNSKKCILIQNLANYVEQWDSIDTTPTTQSLLKLFGYVSHVITNYTQEIKKLEPKRFLYTAKASKSERNAGCEGLEEKQTIGGGGTNNTDDDVCGKYGSIKAKGHNFHPTVKPLALMEYLINLIMPPKDGLILDPFAGSGTTILACKRLGYNAIGIEREAEYCEIANARISNG